MPKKIIAVFLTVCMLFPLFTWNVFSVSTTRNLALESDEVIYNSVSSVNATRTGLVLRGPYYDEVNIYGYYGYTVPVADLLKGTPFTVRGIVSSDNKVVFVSAGIYSLSGEEIYVKSATPNTQKYDLRNMDAYILFDKLEVGTYLYKVTAKDGSGVEKTLAEQMFNVSDIIIDAQPTYPSVTLPKGGGFRVRGTIYSNYKLKSVSAGIYAASGEPVCVPDTVYPNYTSYNLEALDEALLFSHLDVGDYIYRVTAVDVEGTTVDVIHHKFSVNAPASYPHCLITDAARIRQDSGDQSCVIASMATVYTYNNPVFGDETFYTGDYNQDSNAFQFMWGVTSASLTSSGYYGNTYWKNIDDLGFIRYLSDDYSENMLFRLIYNAVCEGKPVVIYAGMHASVVIGYNGDTTKLDPNGFVMMEIVYGSAEKYQYEGYSQLLANYLDTPIPRGSLGCFKQFNEWNAGNDYLKWIIIPDYEGRNETFETCTIQYHANGGNGAPQSQVKRRGTPLTLSSIVPVREGYSFAGWALSPTAESPSYYPGGTFEGDASVTLYAIWHLNNESVNLNMNVQTMIEANSVTVKWNAVTPDSAYTLYLFDISSGTRPVFSIELKETEYTVPDLSSGQYKAIVNENSGLYNISNNFSDFEIEEAFLVHFNANGGQGGPEKQIKIPGVPLSLEMQTPERVGHIFKGWALTAEATVASYQPGSIYSEDKEVTLYAVWEPSVMLSMYVNTMPQKTEYYTGEAFDTTGLTLHVIYSGNVVETVQEGFTCNYGTFHSAGEKLVTITYGTISVGISIHVTDPQIEKIEVTAYPVRTVYSAGESFDPAGMVVTAYLDNGQTRELSSYDYYPGGVLTVNDRQIQISYENLYTYLDITVVEEQNPYAINIHGVQMTEPGERISYQLEMVDFWEGEQYYTVSFELIYNTAYLSYVENSLKLTEAPGDKCMAVVAGHNAEAGILYIVFVSYDTEMLFSKGKEIAAEISFDVRSDAKSGESFSVSTGNAVAMHTDLKEVVAASSKYTTTVTGGLILKPESTFILDEDTSYLMGIYPNMGYTEFVTQFEYTPLVFDLNGNRVLEGYFGYIGTGFSICYSHDATEEKRYVVVVSGDVDGNGIVEAQDYILIKRAYLEEIELKQESVAFSAADVNRNYRLDSNDYMLVRSYVLGIKNLYNK